MFEDDRFYRTDDPALSVLASRGTLAKWRHLAIGPPWHKIGRTVIYAGADLNRFLAERRVEPDNSRAA